MSVECVGGRVEALQADVQGRIGGEQCRGVKVENGGGGGSGEERVGIRRNRLVDF